MLSVIESSIEIGEGSFPGQREGEKIEFYIRRHLIAVIVPVLILLIVESLLATLCRYWWQNLRYHLGSDANILFLVLSSVGLLAITHLIFAKIINYFLKVTVITNSRIINMRCTAVLSRERDIIELERIQDLRVVQTGILKRLLNFGSIEIHDASGQQIFTFRRVSNPHKYLNAISHIYKKVLHGNSLHHGL